jgi:hypothetical protein
MGFFTAWIAGILEIIMPGRKPPTPDATPVTPAAADSTPAGPPEHPATVKI